MGERGPDQPYHEQYHRTDFSHTCLYADRNIPHGHDDPSYDIGVVGVGHWATKFQDAIRDDTLTYGKAVDVVPYEDKQDVLDALGMKESDYTALGPEEPLPESFLTDVDVVQIASPIRFHEEQTLQAIEDGDAVVVTEKAYGPASDAYDTVQDAAREQNTVTYPHLHYLQKQPTRWLDGHIDDMTEAYGPVEHVDATFVETYSDEDARRNWIFRPENGGIVMDWIHPVEVLASACDADFDEVLDAQGYLTEPAYTADHPTAVRTDYAVSGDRFTDDATATVRIGKGFDPGQTRKAMRLHFDDAQLDAVYTGSSTERTTDYRGTIMVTESISDRLSPVALDLPEGGTPYELMAQDMLNAVETGETPVTDDALAEMYDAVDRTNDAVYATCLEDSDEELEQFMQDAFRYTGL